jgi:integrase
VSELGRERREPDVQRFCKPWRPPLGVHDLRHTFASHLIVDLKLDVAQVSRILGHARPSITLDTYTHLFDQAAHAANIRQLMTESLFGRLLADSGVGDSG